MQSLFNITPEQREKVLWYVNGLGLPEIAKEKLEVQAVEMKSAILEGPLSVRSGIFYRIIYKAPESGNWWACDVDTKEDGSFSNSIEFKRTLSPEQLMAMFMKAYEKAEEKIIDVGKKSYRKRGKKVKNDLEKE